MIFSDVESGVGVVKAEMLSRFNQRNHYVHVEYQHHEKSRIKKGHRMVTLSRVRKKQLAV